MKRFFEKYPLSEILDLIAAVVEYFLPIFAGIGVLHLLLCDNSASLVWRIIVYVLAAVVCLFGYFVLIDRRKKIDELERELEEKK